MTTVSFVTSITSLIMSFVNHIKTSRCVVETPQKKIEIDVVKNESTNI